MKLQTPRQTITHSAASPGLLSGEIKYEIKEGTSTMKWTGPKIPPAVWSEILVFFKDTFDRTDSECQVRLYCNPKEATWAAWAYPQRARSHMTAEELVTPEAAQQREQFKSSEGWVYLGTVHHHCGASAFQSGTDREDEANQDGLHITVGRLSAAQYDLHARFTFAGSEFSPDMSVFWEIGPEARALIPEQLHDIVARHQMTLPPPADATYPQQWKDNLIDPPKPVGFQNGSVGSTPSVNGAQGVGSPGGGNFEPEWKRKEFALRDVKTAARQLGLGRESIDAAFAYMTTNKVIELIRKSAIEYRLGMFDVCAEWEWEQNMAESMGENWRDANIT